jgi:hypothetical protein
MHHFGRPDLLLPDPGSALLWYERSAMGGCDQGRDLLFQLMPPTVRSCSSTTSFFNLSEANP